MTTLAGLLNTLTSLVTLLGSDPTLYPAQMTVTNNTAYDYIIVGAGTAGCILAKRLVAANYSVLLAESGGDPPYVAVTPSTFYLLPETSVDHDYSSVLDTYAAQGQGNYTRLTSGNMLGGSSSLNHLLFIRGPPSSYDNWANITGDESWSYDNLLPYFIKSENCTDNDVYSNASSYHGKDGPIGLSRQTHENTKLYMSAMEEAGHATVLDLNANVSIGYEEPLLSINDGTRQTTALSYLKSVKDNANLYVTKNTIVSKVIIENNVAVGVEAIYENVTYTFRANKEVILSAGAFNTPQILMLSGVGPKDHLESLNISVVADLPVGENLVVPPAVCLVHKTKSHLLPVPSISSVAALFDFTKLPFSLFVGSASSNESSTIPNYQTYNLILPHDVPLLVLACILIYGYETSICTDWQSQVSSRDSMYSVVVNFEVESRGSVRLNSTDPTDEPLIKTGIFTNEKDLDTMVAIIKDFIAVDNTTVFKNMDAEIVGLDLSECSDLEAGSDEFWRCYILQRVLSPFLYSGSCAMGTVVDNELKVKGIDKLRIVDASVFPDVIRSATNPATIAVAEKAADMILA